LHSQQQFAQRAARFQRAVRLPGLRQVEHRLNSRIQPSGRGQAEQFRGARADFGRSRSVVRQAVSFR